MAKPLGLWGDNAKLTFCVMLRSDGSTILEPIAFSAASIVRFVSIAEVLE
jgi:hypothetical protein